MKKLLLLLALLALLPTIFAIVAQASFVEIKEINVKGIFYDDGAISGSVTVVNGEITRELAVSLYNAASGGQIQSLRYPLSGVASQTFAFDFGIRSAGNYKIVAEITTPPCSPCRKEETITVMQRARALSIPEIDNALVLAVLLGALSLILPARKSN